MAERETSVLPGAAERRKMKEQGVNRLRRIAADSGSSRPFRSAKRDDNEEMSILC
jgi:hypothetical protein